MSRLDESIDQLYRAFATVPRPNTIPACECCVPPEIISQLKAAFDVRAISPDLLSSYASSAFLTAGSVADYLYFLPRILHVSATDGSWWPDAEITGRAIKAAEPEHWNANQRSAVEKFFTAVIHSTLHPDQHHQIDSWMCAIGNSGFPVDPHLHAIQKHDSAVLSYFNDNSSTLPERKMSNGFWSLPSASHDAVVNWFHSKPVRTLVSDLYGYVFDTTPEASSTTPSEPDSN